MKVHCLCLFSSIALLCLLGMGPALSPEPPAPGAAAEPLSRSRILQVPLSFEENLGQAPDEVNFLARGLGYSLYLTPGEMNLVLRSGQDGAPARRTAEKTGQPASKSKSRLVRISLPGSNSEAAVEGLQKLSGTSSYFRGKEPSGWKTGIPHYGRVAYRGIYNGVDLVLYGNQRRLEYDFVVAPGTGYEQIRLSFDGPESLRIDDRGDLVLQIGDRHIRQHQPVIYQDIEGQRVSVEGRYRLTGDREAGFEVGEYDRGYPLVIDPVLVYFGYLGGTRLEDAEAIAVDGSGNAYVTGATSSNDFPTANPYPGGESPGCSFCDGPGDEAFVTKISADGSSLIYSAYLGGDENEEVGHAIAVDSAGNAYVAGFTASDDFPTTTGAFQELSSGSDEAFITKINPTGSALVYSTYLGGEEDESAFGIALDSAGNAYVTGSTSSGTDASPPFPRVNPLPAGAGNQNQCISCPSFPTGFASKLNAAGSGLIYSTYLGGTFTERSNSIAVSGSNAFVAGVTSSTDFPTVNAFQNSIGTTPAAFMSALDASGSSLTYSTFLGEQSEAEGIATDGAANVYVAGYTDDAFSYPTTSGAFQETAQGSTDAFVSKIDPSQSGSASLIYSTLLGGSAQDFGAAIAVNSDGEAFVAGDTDSADFPTQDPIQSVFGGEGEFSGDAFVTKLTADGDALVYSTYLGGANSDAAFGIALGPDGSAFIAGFTESDGLAAGAQNTSFDEALDTNFRSDGFVAQIRENIDLVLSKSESVDPVVAGAGPGNLTYVVTVTNQGPAVATGVEISESLSFPADVTVDSITPSAGTTFSTSITTWAVGTLAVGQSETLTVVLTVGSAAPQGTDIISNTASVAASDQNRINMEDDSLTVRTSIVQAIDLVIGKTESVDPVVAGSGPGNLTYVVTLTNNGPSRATGVEVSESLTLPPGVVLESITPSGTTTFGVSVAGWSIGALDVGASETLTVVLLVDASAAAGEDNISNTAAVIRSDQNRINTVNDSVTVSTSVARSVDLLVAKSESVDPVIAGSGPGNLIYTVTVTNNGPSNAGGVQLSETLSLPAGVTVNSITPAAPTTFAGTTWAVGDLAVGVTRTLTVSLTVDATTASGTDIIRNTAAVTASNEPRINTTDDSITVATSVGQSADLGLVKTDSPDPVLIGNQLTYTLQVTNAGPSNATGVVLTDELPAGVTFLRSAPLNANCSLATQTVTCTLGNLSSAQSSTVTITVEVGLSTSGILTNQAHVNGQQTDPDTANNTAVVTTMVSSEADLAVTLAQNAGQAAAGTEFEHRITVTNSGPALARQVRLLERIPFGVELVRSIISPSGSCSEGAGLIICSLPNLAVDASATVDLILRSTQAGQLVINVTANASGVDPVPGNNQLEFNLTVNPSSDLVLVKTSASRAILSRDFVYTLTVENQGPSNSSGVVVTDVLPSGLTFVSAEDGGAGTTCQEIADIVTCLIGTLEAAARTEFRITVRLDSALRGMFSNQAEVAGAEIDLDPSNNISAAASLAIEAGDLNGDGVLDASDVVNLILEIGDGDGENVVDVEGGSFFGNIAMDVNGDGMVDLNDYPVLLDLIFGATASPSQASPASRGTKRSAPLQPRGF